jgi:hypothetical protein
MPKNRIIIILAVLVALLPLLGFPHAWESFFQMFAGVAIVGVSVWSTIDRKISLRAKAQMRQARRTVAPEASVLVPEETPEFGKRVTDFYPKTGQQGRRASDIIKPNNSISPSEPLN